MRLARFLDDLRGSHPQITDAVHGSVVAANHRPYECRSNGCESNGAFRRSVHHQIATELSNRCAAEAVQSLMGEPKPYSIIVTETGSNVEVTLTSMSGQYDCTFTRAAADSRGFTTLGGHGFYTCRSDFVTKAFQCSDGTQANLITFGQDVSGSTSGDDISGRWEIAWVDLVRSDVGLITGAEFTGHRQ